MDVFDLVCRRVIYPLWARREGRTSARLCRELDRRQTDSPAIIRTRQCAALRRLLRHAEDSVPYYRTLFRRAGLCAEDIVELVDLSALPILSKSDIREQGLALLSTSYRGQALTRKKTSGSTGVPLEVKLDPSGLEWKRACTLRADEWCGWRRGQRVAKVWGNPEYKQHGVKGYLRNWLYERAVHLDTLQMTSATIRHFADTLWRKRPELIFGHAHSVYL